MRGNICKEILIARYLSDFFLLQTKVKKKKTRKHILISFKLPLELKESEQKLNVAKQSLQSTESHSFQSVKSAEKYVVTGPCFMVNILFF